jgi:hypothetical protein
MAAVPPTDAELDTFIRARLASMGIDLGTLPTTTPNPTGSPTAAQVLTSLRSFVRGTIVPLSAYQLPAAPGAGDPLALQQQTNPPALYPSITSAWNA